MIILKTEKHISIRINSEMLDKLHYVSKYNGRSANGQILYIIRTLINSFESENGEITKEDIIDMYIKK